jgi:hypothetical protein
VRKSFYLCGTEICGANQVLLFHILTGAIDIVSKEFWAALEDWGEEAEPTGLTGPEIERLKKRGYLVDDSLEHEKELNKKVLQIAARSERDRVEVKLTLPQDGRNSAPIAKSDIDELFSLIRSIAGDDGPIAVGLEITATEVEPQILEDLLGAVAAYDLVLIPEVTIAGLGALLPWRNSRCFEEVVLTSDRSTLSTDISETSEKIIGFFEHQVAVSWRCKVDGMRPEQLASIRSIRDMVRRRYLNFGVLLLSSRSAGAHNPPPSESAVQALPVVSTENEPLLLALNRYIWRPEQVNYNPFFRREPATLVFDVSSKDLAFQPGGGGGTISGIDAVRQLAPNWRTASHDKAYVDIVNHAPQCVSCKFSLFCGRDWIGEYGYGTMERCASMLEGRIAQVLPPLFFNLRGAWAPPAKV